MRRKLFKYIFILIFILFQQNLIGQRLKFTTDTAFLKELFTYFPVPEKNEVNPTLTLFSNTWNSNQLNSKQKEQIILISNQLLKKRAKPIPYFENYLRIILSLINSKTQSSSFNTWLKFFEELTLKEGFNGSAINGIFENIIFLNDSSSFFKSAAVVWKHNALDYKLIYNANEEPRIYFNKTDLICYSKRDSTLIKGTSGFYFPISDKWTGKGGLVTWERSGLNKDSVYAKLNNYRINLKFPEYKADSVEFINKKYFVGKLEGRLEEKVLANATGEKASYPKFESYNKKVDLKKVVPNIDFSGGFSMSGSKFVGTGDSLNNAELFIYKKNDLFAKASSKSFVFDKDNILGNNTQVKVFIDNDSIGHPGLYFNYLIKNRKLALNRSGTGSYRSTFYDTYHKLDVDVSEISFNLDDTVLLFKSPPASQYRKAIFESRNYFSENSYDEIALMDMKNPLEIIKDISGAPGEEFTVYHLAAYLNKAESYCVNMLNRLSDFGFVNFDVDKGIAYPLQKLFDYVKANYKKKDYDAIRIISEPATGNNAILNLKDKILTIFGVKPFPLSDNRRVGIIPENSTININKDLEIDFDGKLQAGLARIYGKDLTFHYDSFYVKLESVDSLSLYYQSEEKNKDSLYEYSHVTSTIDSVTGLLRIDKPNNKSGVKTIANYPIFESHNKSYVFYDQKSTKDTVYKKEEFFFENFPFEIDSLNTITKNQVRIKGIFKSGGVFPDFNEDLLVQTDSSLGFVHNLGDSGIVIYNGLGKYNNTITLNNTGLKGDGKVSYLNTDLYSSQFDFYPDSMNTYANKIEMAKQLADSATRYPQAHSDSAYVHWKPKHDQMFINTINEPIKVFEEKAQFLGMLELKPSELSGKGELTFIDANLKSDSYTFYDESFTADTSDFKLQPVLGEESPFLTYNVNADVNFDKKIGLFKSNGNNSYIDFPVNKYKCYMNNFLWQMGINKIEIGTEQNLQNDSINLITELDSTLVNPAMENAEFYNFALSDTTYSTAELKANSKFISTQSGQDSLSFYAHSSSYDITNFIIKAKGVKFINVADARIFPSSPLFIEPGAVIKPLNNTRIVANRETRFHKFFDATANIYGAKNYSGSGDYEYIDRLDSLQIIHFNEILVDGEIQTRASGTIAEKDSFMLGPEFSYFGNISIKSEQQFIDFEGYTQINHICNNRMQNFWLRFESAIDPDSILIPLDSIPKDNEMRKLMAGMYATYDSVGLYTSFLSTKRRFTDMPILETRGLLYFNPRTGYYEILDSAKLNNHNKEGNYLAFHRSLCLVLGEGKMDFGVKLGQVKLSPVGAIRQNLNSWNTQMEVMLPVDFFFNDLVLNQMSVVLNENISLEPVDPSKKEYKKAFKELVGLERSNQLMKDFSLLGAFETVPIEMKHTLFFSKVMMKWNNDQTAWQSEGKIGIGNLNGLQINKMVDGIIEVKRVKSGDILNIYLEITPKIWFFFTYTRGTLKAVSSDDLFNKLIIELKDKERKSPIKDDDNPYMFFPATNRTKDIFIEEIKKQKEKAKEEKDFNLDNNVVNEDENNEETESESDEDEFNVIDNGNDEIELEDIEENTTNELEKENNNLENEVKTDDNKEIIKDNPENNNVIKSEEVPNNDIIKTEEEPEKEDVIKTEELEKDEIKTEDINEIKTDIKTETVKENPNIDDPNKKTEVKEEKKETEIKETEDENKKKYEEEEEEKEEEEEDGGGG